VALSVQVLQEFDVEATRSTRSDAPTHEQAAALVESFLRLPTTAVTAEVMRAALATRQRFGLSFWGAAVLEAGRALGCDVVLSEDVGDGEDCDGVRVENPFAAT
jgi:predicted nucleic acid-binding protein